MIPVKRNHFYTKEIISNAVGIYPQFKDMTSSTETTFEFKGGLGATRYVISGQTSETPFPGQSELVGGYFQSYVTGMSVSGGAMLPVMTGYKLQDGFPIKEGGLTMATGSTTVGGGTTDTIGDKLWVSTSIIDAGSTWLEENFDGADKSLGTALMQQSASATLSLADAYVSPKQGADNLFMGGDAFFGGGASNDAEHNLGKYFSEGGPSGDRSRVYVRPVKKNRMEGLWTAVDDYRNDKQKWQIYAPYWKWNTIRGILNFDKKTSATNNEDALPDITTNNTIFNDLHRTKSYGSTFTYNSDSPYIESTMELTSSQGGTGQALRMYHSWGVSGDPKNNFDYWKQMKVEDGVGVQTNYASLYDIPYPIPNNVGAFGQTSITSGAMGIGDQRIAYPEINLSMNISKLMPAPAITHTAGSAIVGTNAICYGNQSGSTGDVQGTTQRAMNADSSFKTINKTFWRSVVVTFSNYTPEEAAAQTLDQFLKYGMDQAFGLITGSTDVVGGGKADFTNDQMGPKIVCGVVFESFYSTDSGIATNLDGSGSQINPTSVYAYSLPVSRTFESGTSGGSYDEQYGMIRCTGGSNWMAPDNTMLHRPVMGPLTGSSKTGRPYVEIPQDETFNMKVVFDVQQPWWKGTDYGWYMEDTDTSNDQYTFPTASEDVYGTPASAINNVVGGVPIRAYFDTIKPPRQGSTTTDTTNLPEYDEDKIPYINVGLPAYDSTYFHQYMSDMDVWGNRQSGLATNFQRGGNFLFPKHMTIWVSNCGMAPASGSTPTYWNSTNTWFDSTYWVSDDYAFPLNSDGDWTGPATIESEVFIDSIKFKNWGAGTVSQHSAMAGPLRKFMSSNTQGVPSPAKTVDKGANQSHARNFSVDGHLPEIPAGQILTLGVKHKDWVMQHVEAAPAGGTEGGSVGAKASYLLFNNFSTTQFGEIDRFTPTVGWMSTKTLGSDSDGSYVNAAGWDMWGQIASGSDADVQATQGENQTMFIQTGASTAPSTGTPFTRSYYSGEVYEGQVYASFGYSNTDTQDFLSTDGLTQKGFVKLTVSSGSADTNIHPRENPMCSAKIMEIGEKSANLEGSTELTKNTIRVDEIDIFMEDADDDYIIYRAGEYLTNNEIAGSSDPTTALGFVQTVKASEIDKDNDIVKLVVTDTSDDTIGGGIKYADDETTELCVGKHLSQLYISPKRIWFNMLLVGENWQYPRKYESINIVGEKPATANIATQLGTTFNEATYTYNTGSITTKGLSAMPENPWIFDPAEEATAVIANKDYGFGAYDESGNKGAEVGKETPIINKHMSLDFSGVVDADKLAPNSECSMVLNLSSDVTNKAFTIVADDTTLDESGSTYYRPQYIWEYKDALPTVTDFQVGSAFDVLSPDVNLYELTKQPINNLKFTWSEEAEDIWYRHLIVNPSGNIENKYHNCSFWAPLNEPNISYVTAGEHVPASYYTTHTQGMTKKTLNAPQASVPVTQYHSRVDGIQGYALWKNSNIKSLQFSDSGSNVTTTGTAANGIEAKYSMLYDMSDAVYGTDVNNPWQNAWTLVVHCNPNNQDAAPATKAQGMTVCGVAMYQNAANSGSSGGTPTCNVFAPSGVSDGNYASGSLTWQAWTYNASFANSQGGLDVLHVYVKDNKVYCHYNHEFSAHGAVQGAFETFKTLSYEVLLLSSSTSYPLDGTEPMSITLVWQGKNNPTQSNDSDTTIRSDDQFRMYINGQLEDSTSATRGSFLDGASDNPINTLQCKGNGGFSRANWSQFVIGSFDTDNGNNTGAPPHIGNITAEIGSSSETFAPSKYDNRVNGFHGTIEEIILYPYEVYMVPNANEFVLETNTLPDYTSTGSAGIEKNYNARLFLYDYTNIRGKASDEVAATTAVQWKVTGV